MDLNLDSDRFLKADWFWVGVICLVGLIFSWPVVLGGQSLYLTDFMLLGLPQAHLTVSALSSGEIPHWEPLMDFGYPYMADPHSLLLYPPAIILFGLPLVWAYNLFVVLHVLLAALSFFVLLRCWRFEPMASTLGAVAYGFCGFTCGLTAVPLMLRGMAWIPLAVAAFTRYSETGYGAWIAATASALFLVGTGSGPQQLLFSILLVALAPALNPGGDHLPRARRWIAGLVASVALAGGLMACQYLPLLQLTLHSNRLEGLSSVEIDRYPIRVGDLPSMALPLPFPDPRQYEYLANFYRGQPSITPTLYWGLPVLILALVGTLGAFSRCRSSPRPSRSSIGLLSMLGLLGLLLAMGGGTPVHALLLHLIPPLKAFRFTCKYFELAAFSMSVLSAVGIQALIQRREDCMKLTMIGSAACSLLLVAGMGALAVSGSAIPAAFLTGVTEAPPELGELVADLQSAWIAGLGSSAGLMMLLFCSLWLVHTRRSPPRFTAALVVAVVVADLLLTSRTHLATIERVLVESPPPAVELIGTQAGGASLTRFRPYQPETKQISTQWTFARLLLLQYQLMTNLTGVRWGLSSLESAGTLRTITGSRYRQISQGLTTVDSYRLQTRMGQSYVVRLDQGKEFIGDARVAGRSGPLVVLKLPDVLPRAFIAHRARPVAREPDMVQCRKAIQSMPAGTLYEPAPGTGAELLVPAELGPCVLVDKGRNRLVVEFELKGEGMLVVLDAYFPNWKAMVNGEERAIHRVAGMFRGVRVKQGETHLEMFYDPWPFHLGLVISSLALLVAVLLLASRFLGIPGRLGQKGDRPLPDRPQ